MEYELYYHLPWPDWQDYEGKTEQQEVEFEMHSVTDIQGGFFVEKEWFDANFN